MTIAAWVTSIAAALQAIAACVLVRITTIYVHHTKTLAEEAQRQAQKERRHRQESAIQAIRFELVDIIRCCFEGQIATPVRLPTYTWDSQKGDVAVLGLVIMSELAILFSAVREANSQYDQFVTKPDWTSSEPFYNRWNEQKDRVLAPAKKIGLQIAELDVKKTLDAAEIAPKQRPRRG